MTRTPATTSLTVNNLTQDELFVQLPAIDTHTEEKNIVTDISPQTAVVLLVHKRPFFARKRRHIILSKGADTRSHAVSLDRKCGKAGMVYVVKDIELPWTVYWVKENKTAQRLVILPRRDMSTFLSDLADDLPLSSLCLPGTHDTMAFYGWPISQCQTRSTPLSAQLRSGVRIIDIRLAVINGRLIAYHGISDQREPFQVILSTIHSFLNDPATARETLVMSIKQEDFKKTPGTIFSASVHAEILESTGGIAMWFLENRIPKLGEVRGKVIMLSRFGGDGTGWENGLEGMGIHPPIWPDSSKSGFSYNLKDTLVRMHDWYAIPSFLDIPEKVQRSTAILIPPSSEFPPVRTLNFTYISAASVPLALPTTVACGFGWPQVRLGIEGANSRVCRWLLQQLVNGDGSTLSEGAQGEKVSLKKEGGVNPNVIRGWVMLDFFAEPTGGPIVPLLVEFNFIGRGTQ